ncbi:MAG TPA: hypothetical protein VKD69_04975 [Vicinamibacterales bacterium]|nr:hypothetical protein [Vicinamibacterales bacterium]
MTRSATGLCVAAAMACAVSLGAQTSTPTTQRSSTTTEKSHDVTLTGCLARDTSGGGFMLNHAEMDSPSASSTTGSSTTTTAGATTTSHSSASGSAPASWMLMGGSDLDKHVGHKIQVTGKTSWDGSMDHTSTASAAGAGTTATEPNPTTAGTTGTLEEQRKGDRDAHGKEPHLEVQSVKMISASCP